MPVIKLQTKKLAFLPLMVGPVVYVDTEKIESVEPLAEQHDAWVVTMESGRGIPVSTDEYMNKLNPYFGGAMVMTDVAKKLVQ